MKKGMTTRKITKEFISANFLETTVEHNGCQGGDAGHGGFIKITFENISSTMMLVNGERCEKFSFEFQGSAERQTFVESLQFILDELKSDVTY
jgi:hypothetical protein